MAKLFIVLAQEQKTVSHFRHLKKISRIFAKKIAKKIFFELHLTKLAKQLEMKKIKSIALLYHKIKPTYTSPLIFVSTKYFLFHSFFR